METDPKSIERGNGGTTFALQVSPVQLYRQWRESVRGRVGALVRGKWHAIRMAYGEDEIRAMYDAGTPPPAAALRIAEAWAKFLQAFETLKS